jgi:hypothetical protein
MTRRHYLLLALAWVLLSLLCWVKAIFTSLEPAVFARARRPGRTSGLQGRTGGRVRMCRTLLTRRIPGYLDNPLRQNMWRAGHAHPGVWLVLGLVGMLYVDQTPLSAGLKSLVRVTLLLAPILVSLGFFLSVLSPRAERPNGLINLIYLAALLLAVGVVTLGIGLFQA